MIDIGSTLHMAAVTPDRLEMPMRASGTDLHDLAAWLRSRSVTMEVTGGYGLPAFEVLERHGFDVILMNARYAKSVPGRKAGVSDAGWLWQLHPHGLLRGSFRPTGEIATQRAQLCQRERLTEYAAVHRQHMQKALLQMNLQLHPVVSDFTGATRMRIIRDGVAISPTWVVQFDCQYMIGIWSIWTMVLGAEWTLMGCSQWMRLKS